MKSERRKGKFGKGKALLFAVLFAMLTFVSVGCASGTTPPEEAWNQTFGGTGYDAARAVQQTADGGYVVAGETYSYAAGYDDFWREKVKEEGTPTIIASIFPGIIVNIYSDTMPAHPGNYSYFYTNSATNNRITIRVEIDPATFLNVDISAYDVSADFSNVTGTSTIVTASSATVGPSGHYIFIISYDLESLSVDAGPHVILVNAKITHPVAGVILDGPIGGCAAVININPKEGIPGYNVTGLNNPETTDWRTIVDFSNVNNLTCQHDTGGELDGKLELLEPVNLIDISFITAIQNLGANLVIASQEMSIHKATTAMQAFNKHCRLTFYGLGSGMTSVYAMEEGSTTPIEIYNATTGYINEEYLGHGTPYFEDGNFVVEVNHWTTYLINQHPIVEFTYTPFSPIVGANIIFNATASRDPDGNITNYAWNFGDGNITTITEPVIAHSYASAGSYDITLTVTDDDGATNSTSKVIEVYSEVDSFDTGTGTYPSIMGTHKGEIKPSANINVSNLYTYACAGTGGHTESIKLYENGELIASGIWSGYQDDWHNITITTVILQAGHTYNYTIVTGSYPQIIHATSKEVTGGTITCTSFVDANGKTYTDWIPAIMLE